MSAKRLTSSDVAKRANVSRTTVSLILNNVPGVKIREETRQRVLQIAHEMGYVPDAAAQALVSRKSKIVALILTRDQHHLASDAYLTQILNSLVTNLREHNMGLILEIVEEDHSADTYLKLVQSNRIDGIIFSGPRFDDEALQILKNEDFPTVLMGQLPCKDFYCVDVDNQGAAKIAVRYLIEAGHRRIACITNADLSYTAAVDRLAGYKDALADAGIPDREDYVRLGDFDLDSGYREMGALLKLDSVPTAVFVASDVVAFGAMAAIREHGKKAPEDLSIVGFDDVPMARFVDPKLTTIRLPAAELGRQTCKMLINIIQHNLPEQKQILLETELIVRDSSGKPPYP
jgi:LacI family transcriptional regulator